MRLRLLRVLKVLKILYVIAFIFSILLGLFVLDIIIIPNEKAPLLGAIGIIISAFIASFSVKKSIDNTNRIENEKIEKEKKELISYIDNEIFTFLLFLRPIIKAYQKNKSLVDNHHTLVSKPHFEKIENVYEKTYNNICNEKILFKMSLEIQKDIHDFFDYFTRLKIMQELSNERLFETEKVKKEIIQDFMRIEDFLIKSDRLLKTKHRTLEDIDKQLQLFDINAFKNLNSEVKQQNNNDL